MCLAPLRFSAIIAALKPVGSVKPALAASGLLKLLCFLRSFFKATIDINPPIASADNKMVPSVFLFS